MTSSKNVFALSRNGLKSRFTDKKLTNISLANKSIIYSNDLNLMSCNVAEEALEHNNFGDNIESQTEILNVTPTIKLNHVEFLQKLSLEDFLIKWRVELNVKRNAVTIL